MAPGSGRHRTDPPRSLAPSGRHRDLGEDREPGCHTRAGATRLLAVPRFPRRSGCFRPGDARRAAPDHCRHRGWPRQRTIACRGERGSRPGAEPVGPPVAEGRHPRAGGRDQGRTPAQSPRGFCRGPDRAPGQRSLTRALGYPSRSRAVAQSARCSKESCARPGALREDALGRWAVCSGSPGARGFRDRSNHSTPVRLGQR